MTDVEKTTEIPERLTLLNNMSLVYPIPNNYATFTVEDGERGDKLEKWFTNLTIIVRSDKLDASSVSNKLDANSFTSDLRNIFTFELYASW